MSRLKDLALDFATKAHEGQYRKATSEPYIVHPINVANMLEEAGFQEEVIVAGLLHDTVEDTTVTIEEIRNIFGENVAKMVASNTENKELGWEARKQHTISSLVNAPFEVKALVVADKLDNLTQLKRDSKTLGEDELWKSFKRGREKQKWYYEGVLNSAFKNLSHYKAPDYFYNYKNLFQEFFGEN